MSTIVGVILLLLAVIAEGAIPVYSVQENVLARYIVKIKVGSMVQKKIKMKREIIDFKMNMLLYTY